MRYILILLGAICFSHGAVLLTNGDFEQTLDIGWEQQIQGQHSADTIDRDPSYDPDPDYEVRVKKYDAAHARLYQIVNIATTDLEFTVTAKIQTREITPDSVRWAHASVVLEYLDTQYGILGQSRVCHNSPECPYINTPTFHMIEVTDTANWYTHAFNIDDELLNLPGVNQPDIAKIRVSLYDTTNGC